jgi:hypothetical protein
MTRTVTNFAIGRSLVSHYQDNMQYTFKIALLAVALFGTSACALPFSREAEYLEAREVDNELSSRELGGEFNEMYLDARAYPSLETRDVESLDFEAREYLEYLETRAAVTTVCLAE